VVAYLLNYMADTVGKTGEPILLIPHDHKNVPNSTQDIEISFKAVNAEEREEYQPNTSKKIHHYLMDQEDIPAVITYVVNNTLSRV
jgi:hypothetical protein